MDLIAYNFLFYFNSAKNTLPNVPLPMTINILKSSNTTSISELFLFLTKVVSLISFLSLFVILIAPVHNIIIRFGVLEPMQHCKIVFLNLLFHPSFGWWARSTRTCFEILVNRGFCKFFALVYPNLCYFC